MRNTHNKIVDNTVNLAIWMEKRKYSGLNLIQLKTMWHPIFVYYMHRFARMGYYHDWNFIFKEYYTWEDIQSRLHYVSDRMNFGRLVEICTMIERIKKNE
ncbi:MAG: hypothetical protein WC755_07095 [Candidatus Woesearchaeota archaeon]|jgi:hypothetical protein